MLMARTWSSNTEPPTAASISFRGLPRSWCACVIIPRSDKITVAELAQALRDVFGPRRAVQVTSAEVTAYSAKRLDGISPRRERRAAPAKPVHCDAEREQRAQGLRRAFTTGGNPAPPPRLCPGAHHVF